MATDPYKRPSALDRTIQCNGWYAMCRRYGIKQPPSSFHANEGTVAHKIGEKCLAKNIDPMRYVNHLAIVYARYVEFIKPHRAGEYKNKKNAYYITAEMANAVRAYVNECQRQRELYGNRGWLEQWIDLSWLIKGTKGTIDFLIYQSKGVVSITDYKHGAGVLVSLGEKVGDCAQQSAYGLAALKRADDEFCVIDKVILNIVQPRHYLIDNPVSTVEFEPNDVYQWGYDVLLPAIERAGGDDPPVKAGPKCQFCWLEKAKDENDNFLCPAKRAAFEEETREVYGLVKQHEPAIDKLRISDIGNAKLGELVEFYSRLGRWINDAVKPEIRRRLDFGQPSTELGHKLVRGKRSPRKWLNDEITAFDVINALCVPAIEEELMTQSLLSPSQVIDWVKHNIGYRKEETLDLIENLLVPEPPIELRKKVMVPLSDSREEVEPEVNQMFDAKE